MKEDEEKQLLIATIFECADDYVNENETKSKGRQEPVYRFLGEVPVTQIISRLQEKLEDKGYEITRLNLSEFVRKKNNEQLIRETS